MNAIEKAKDLINKYQQLTVDHYTGLHEHKQMALIAVEEIRDVLRKNGDEIMLIYWEFVKEEIENL